MTTKKNNVSKAQKSLSIHASEKTPNIRSRLFRIFFSLRALILFQVILQIAVLGVLILILNPAQLFDSYRDQRLVGAVSEVINVPIGEEPTVAEIADAEALRNENDVQSEVYKDAQNGDYVLAYSSKMIIYRESTAEVIYEGETPQKLLESTQQRLLEDIVTAAKATGKVNNENSNNPQFQVINDPELLKQGENGDFYTSAQKGDIISYFPDAKMVFLYSMEQRSMINSASYSTSYQFK